MRIHALMLVLSSLVTASTATAQPRDRAAADALFQTARQEFDKGNYEAACEKFAESNRLDPAPGTLLNLSLCWEKVGKLASAWEGYRKVAEQLRDERMDFATKRSTTIEARLPWLTLRLPDNAPKETRVIRDGVEIRDAAFGVALPVDPGRHTLVVEAEGRLPTNTSFTVEEGQRLELVAKLGPPKPEPKVKPVAAPSRKEPPPPVPAGPDPTYAWVAGGLGVAGITTSLVTGAMAMSSRSTVRDHCVENVCDDEGLDAASSGRTYSTISTVSGIVGFAGLGVSTYLFLSGSPEQTPSTAIEAGSLPGGGYMSMTRRF